MNTISLAEKKQDYSGEAEEVTLVLRAKGGDSDALAELLSRYRPRLFATIVGAVNCRQEAEDILQETCLRIIQNISRFRGESGIFSWMFRIAKNECYSHMRRRLLQPVSEPALITQIENRQCDCVPKTHYDEAQQIQEATSRLPANLREILVLRMHEGLAYREIGERLQIELGTVRSRLSRAKAMLKKELLR